MADSVHEIDFKGKAGISFVLIMFAAIFYVLAFSSHSWARFHVDDADDDDPVLRFGLWETCTCLEIKDAESWFVATQVMAGLGLVALIGAMVISTLYMCVHTISKNATLIALIVVSLATSGCIFLAIVIFGAEIGNLDKDLRDNDSLSINPDWSFAMAAIAMFFTIAAGVVSIVQLITSK